ncbi:two-component system OmpR family sensor kinase [Microbacterium endophyticum]|uniref:histidine kinase n=1 Tax=Microbacterium endophyticum TaxID=1526412 RepID=A0A7W4V1G2_9MICO|nr:HAMP domain-containing sensor histidine kinase [Microbacterium endophyticum]MBB2975014.1 two-component system OmpR family sensor kinase [Microbacterium endophyticum]NIK37446.1 two-component system OmpR family sensor kinase [Microbacterium endophyticum]
MTGVTVAVLAIGLLAAGVGTMGFLRQTLGNNLDEQVRQLVKTGVASSVFDAEVSDAGLTFVDKSNATSYFVVIYSPESDGHLVNQGGGDGAAAPEFPDSYTMSQAMAQGSDAVFTLENSAGGAPYRAAVAVDTDAETGLLYTQLVAIPTAASERFMAAFLGIYSFLAIITVIASAFLVRWVVTLTFRSLGQVESTAEAIAAGDFSLRMTDVEAPTTEVGRLKSAINAMLGRIDGALSQRDATVRQMRRFVGDASHELRTPLVTVRGYAELYRMGAIKNPDDIAQSMERIEKEAIRMGVLVEDLLALARLDERRGVEITPIDLRPIARDAALDVGAAAPSRTVTVVDTTALPPRPPLPDATALTPPTTPTESVRRRVSPMERAGSLLRRRSRAQDNAADGFGGTGPLDLSTDAVPVVRPTPVVLGDENRIRQVIANLLGNARRYSPDESPIEVRVGVDAEQQMGWLEIVDHGEGIPPQIRGHIFERFWRADTSRTRDTGGSGLGLSIVASIVESLNGNVEVTDTAGGGATFRVAFPLALGKDAAAHLLIETQPLPRMKLS